MFLDNSLVSFFCRGLFCLKMLVGDEQVVDEVARPMRGASKYTANLHSLTRFLLAGCVFHQIDCSSKALTPQQADDIRVASGCASVAQYVFFSHNTFLAQGKY